MQKIDVRDRISKKGKFIRSCQELVLRTDVPCGINTCQECQVGGSSLNRFGYHIKLSYLHSRS